MTHTIGYSVEGVEHNLDGNTHVTKTYCQACYDNPETWRDNFQPLPDGVSEIEPGEVEEDCWACGEPLEPSDEPSEAQLEQYYRTGDGGGELVHRQQETRKLK